LVRLLPYAFFEYYTILHLMLKKRFHISQIIFTFYLLQKAANTDITFAVLAMQNIVENITIHNQTAQRSVKRKKIVIGKYYRCRLIRTRHVV
jgi:hypothetical protein